MKRAHGHLAFALVATVLSVLTVAEAVHLQHARRINMSVAEWSAPSVQPTAASSRWSAGPAVDHLPPEARLARAVALSRLDYDAALAAFKAIIQSNREDLHRMALYDLGNLNLRQAVQYGLADEAQSLPLTELAKQSYRDLLRRDPTDWDARYNLERALRLAPEDDDDTGEDTGPPDPRQHERTTIADPRMDLP
jgi:mxaK protein